MHSDGRTIDQKSECDVGNLHLTKIGNKVFAQANAWVSVPCNIPEAYRPAHPFWTIAWGASGAACGIYVDKDISDAIFGPSNSQILLNESWTTND